MKTEIDVFDEWAKLNIENYCDAIFDGQCYVMRENSRLTKERKKFLILSLNIGLRAWQASASREGYKLVPVDPTMNMCNQLSGNVENAKLIYKSLIEAA